jgi:hypothetical protein
MPGKEEQMERTQRRPIILSRGRIAVLVAVVCGLVLPSVAASYHINTYFGTASAAWNVAHDSGYNNMKMNRVYRPLYHTFALYYGDCCQYDEDRNTNPFTHNNPGGYTWSSCANVDPYDHNPWPTVTCQYQTFHP